jgi:hypothetical protein
MRGRWQIEAEIRRIISASLAGKNCPCLRRLHGGHIPKRRKPPTHAMTRSAGLQPAFRRRNTHAAHRPALHPGAFPQNPGLFPQNPSAFPRNPSPFPPESQPFPPDCRPFQPIPNALYFKKLLLQSSALDRSAGGSPACRTVWNLRAGRPRSFRNQPNQQ